MQYNLTHASTFSGIGAPEVAAEMLGWTNLFHCEINPFGRAVLDYYFPNAKSYEDITKTDFSEWRGKVNVLTGGFPCQPFSYAGKRRGSEDDRYLWPYMLRCIEQVQPDWFIGENVAGITTMVFPGEDVKVGSHADLFGEGDALIETHERYVLNDICEGLERAGYSVQPILIPACAVGAPHRRDRVWIIAHRDSVPENTLHSGQLERGNDEQGSKRNEWNAGTRSDERLCGRTSGTENPTPNTNSSNDECGKPRTVQSTEGEERICQRNDIRQFEQSDNVRPEVQGLTTDTSSERHAPLLDGGDNDRRTRTEVDGERQDQSLVGVGRYGTDETVTDTESQCSDGHQSEQREYGESQSSQLGRGSSKDGSYLLPANRWRAFPTVSPVYRGNDGLPFDVDDLTIPFSEWKKESLKAYGNAWCVQVGYEIMRAIDELEKQLITQQ